MQKHPILLACVSEAAGGVSNNQHRYMGTLSSAQGRPERAEAARAWLRRLLAALVAVAEVALVPLANPFNSASICAPCAACQALECMTAARCAVAWRPDCLLAAFLPARCRQACIGAGASIALVRTEDPLPHEPRLSAVSRGLLAALHLSIGGLIE